MVAAARYEVLLERPVLTWQGAILLQQAVDEPRSLLVTVHGYRPDGEVAGVDGRQWYRSERLGANFYYLPAGEAGQVLSLPRLTHDDGVTRIELVARPFAATTQAVTGIVSTLCFQDLDPVLAPGPQVITTHAPEAIDV